MNYWQKMANMQPFIKCSLINRSRRTEMNSVIWVEWFISELLFFYNNLKISINS